MSWLQTRLSKLLLFLSKELEPIIDIPLFRVSSSYWDVAGSIVSIEYAYVRAKLRFPDMIQYLLSF